MKKQAMLFLADGNVEFINGNDAVYLKENIFNFEGKGFMMNNIFYNFDHIIKISFTF